MIAPTPTEPTAARPTRRLLNSSTGSIGSAARRSWRTNSKAAAPEAANSARVGAPAQPQSVPPSSRANSSRVTATIRLATPTRSRRRRRDCSMRSGRVRASIAAEARPNGMFR